MLRYCTMLNGSSSDCGTVYRLQAARALHMSIEHLGIQQVIYHLITAEYISTFICFNITPALADSVMTLRLDVHNA